MTFHLSGDQNAIPKFGHVFRWHLLFLKGPKGFLSEENGTKSFHTWLSSVTNVANKRDVTNKPDVTTHTNQPLIPKWSLTTRSGIGTHALFSAIFCIDTSFLTNPSPRYCFADCKCIIRWLRITLILLRALSILMDLPGKGVYHYFLRWLILIQFSFNFLFHIFCTSVSCYYNIAEVELFLFWSTIWCFAIRTMSNAHFLRSSVCFASRHYIHIISLKNINDARWREPAMHSVLSRKVVNRFGSKIFDNSHSPRVEKQRL